MSDLRSKTIIGAQSLGHSLLKPVAALGGFAWEHWRALQYLAAVIGTALWLALNPRYWKRDIRTKVAHQVMTVGLEPIGFVCALAAFVGISVVVQLTFWTGEAGQSQMLGPLLVTVVARELGPILMNLVVIVRTGSAMTTELGVLKISGGVENLQKEGQDPFTHLVMPRMLGVALSTFCLTIVFIVVAFASGYLFAAWTAKGSGNMLLFVNTLSKAVHPKDVSNVLAKTLLPALFASASCCIDGLGVTGTFTDIPQATQKALTRSVAGLFVISATVSLLTYLKA
jgi:phospholipid/cholesterol/gamma-HCH transport system permease protein